LYCSTTEHGLAPLMFERILERGCGNQSSRRFDSCWSSKCHRTLADLNAVYVLETAQSFFRDPP